MTANYCAPIGSREVVIDDSNYKLFLDGTSHQGETKRTGLAPVTASKYAMRRPMFGTFDIPLLPESEWEGRLEQQVKDQAQLSTIRNSGKFGGIMPSTDQNGRGYCWAHSSTSAALILRARDNQPYADLSAYAVACIIKGYRDEGGWGEESLTFMADRGIPSSEFWPQRSVSRANDKPETWANAALHKFSNTEWMSHGNRNKVQMVTCLLLGIPVVIDLNWWSHSILALDLISINPFRIRIWNSWGDSWSENGTGILEGSKAIPDDAVTPRVIRAAA